MKNFKSNNYFYLLLTLIALFSVPQLMANYSADIVDVKIIGDYGSSFKQYPINNNAYKVERAYLQAKDGKAYGIKVRNNSYERIGLVIAVDGRNIISGKKSKLKANERMYVLNPHQSATYDGWRSSNKRVNEFYFTDVPDSYSDRTFGDRSAMGVIAVAVFKEKNGRWYHEQRYDEYSNKRDYKSQKDAPSASSKNRSAQKPGYESESDELGTGYGDDRYSPVRRVEFKAESQAAVKHFIKYESESSLCEMGVINCGNRNKDRNRFWPQQNVNYGYAPPPPSNRYSHYGQGIH